MKHLMTTAIPVLALLFAGSTLAHPPAEGGEHEKWRGERQGKQKMVERMKHKRSKMLRKRVGLAEDTAVEVEAVMARFDPERKQLHKRKKALRHRVQGLLEGDSEDQNQFKAALREFQAIEERHLSLRKEEMKALSSLLTPKQQVILQVTLHRFHTRMKRAVEKRRRQRHRWDSHDIKGAGAEGKRGDRRRGEGRRKRRRGGDDW